MFISIRYKLFATLFAAVVIVATGMFILIHWSFSRNFQSYVNTLETRRIESLAHDLQNAYAKQGSWQFLRQDMHLWHQFLAASTPEGVQQFNPLTDAASAVKPTGQRVAQAHDSHAKKPHGEKSHDGQPHESVRRDTDHLFEFRVVLLDAEKQRIAGPELYPVEMKLVELKHNGKNIGYLGHIPQKNLLALHQKHFIQEQKKSFAFISLFITALAALIAFPAAGRMVGRINALAEGIHHLVAGRYNTQLPVGTADELGQLTRDFNSLALTLEKNESLRRQWVADISHELRTPLAVLQGEIEAIQDGVRELSAQAVGSLHAEILRLNRLVHDLSQLSLSDIGALTYRKEDVDPAEILEEAIHAFTSKFSGKNLAVELDIQSAREGKTRIFGDRQRLHQLFCNILNNAVHYTDSGGRLEIICRTNDQMVEIVFQDSAPGVSANDLERLFERLYRVETSRSRASGGAGIGLAICKNIVEAHNGTIKAEDSPYGGVAIRIYLPLEKS